MKRINTKATLNLQLLDDSIDFSSNKSEVAIINKEDLDIRIAKTASTQVAIVGSKIDYLILIENHSIVTLANVNFEDELADETTFVEGSFFVDDKEFSPVVSYGRLELMLPKLSPGTTTIAYTVIC
ncbi:MAG: hypothetical protein FWD89_04830 [Firmicutes bacterium]|nr:hypothetical protein [Bacillota bacterium]MCL2771606.1 hypothetical protein [Bacillota bacterium]